MVAYGGEAAAATPTMSAQQTSETAVLGLVLSSGRVPPVAELLKPEDFASEPHRLIYGAIRSLSAAGRSTDLVLVQAELERRGHLSRAGGATYLAALLDLLPDPDALQDHVGEVREAAARRTLLADLEVRRRQLASGAPLEDVRNDLRIALTRASDQAVEDLPAVSLAVALAEPKPEIDFLLEPLLPAGGLGLLAAEGGRGKTTFLIQLFLHLAAGRDFLGFRVPAAVPVLYFLAEGARHVFLERTRVAAARLGLELEGLPFFVPDSKSPPAIGSHLRRLISSSEARVVALDTIGLFHDGDENSASDLKSKVIKPLGEIGRDTGAAFIAVHHQGKPNDQRNGRHSIRGTSALVDDVDLVLRLEAPSGERDPLRELVFDKVRHGAIPTPIPLNFDFSFATFTQADADELREAKDASSSTRSHERISEARDRIVKVLRREPEGRSAGDLQKITGIRRQDVFDALAALRADSLAFPEGSGPRLRWKLAMAGRTA